MYGADFEAELDEDGWFEVEFVPNWWFEAELDDGASAGIELLIMAPRIPQTDRSLG